MRVAGKVALVSGAARGIGAATAKLLAQEGAAVVLGDVLEKEGQETAAQIVASGSRATFLPLDVARPQNWQQVIAATIAAYGKLNILVNNAGISGRDSVAETDVATWDRVLEINGKGVFLGIKSALPELRKAGGGSIINISSIYGIIGSETSAAYHASKGAVRILTKAAAIQYAADNIRVNSVHPGFVDSPMTAASHALPEVHNLRLSRTPLGRMGTPEDIAAGILYLASDESSFVTGSELVIDGGMTAQ